MCLFVCVSELSYLNSKKPDEVRYTLMKHKISTLLKHCRAFILLGIQIGCAFNSVAVSTGWAFAVDHAFNLIGTCFHIMKAGKPALKGFPDRVQNATNI